MARPGTRPVRALAVALLLTAALTACSHPVAASPAEYVALGDSYAAGPFTGLPTGSPVGCGRFTESYPQRVAKTLAAKKFTDVTCGGAATPQILTLAQNVVGGSNPPQIDAVGSGTTLVTITIGGNDIGFLSVIVHCAAFIPTDSPCKKHYDAGGVDQLAAAVAATAPKVAAVLAAVKGRAPGARVLLVGYPDLLPEHGGCWPDVPFTDTDVVYLNGVERDLNAMLADQAKAAGATYVDTYTPSIGHDMCSGADTRWIEPLIPTRPAAPFHPNAAGEQQMADEVVAAYRATG